MKKRNKHKYEFIVYGGIMLVMLIIIIAGTAAAANASEKTIAEMTQTTTVATVTEPVETNLGVFKVTAYCPCPQCCGIYADGITATGTTATPGRTIAVDPNVIPYGTEVIIDGNTFIAEDCGGSIKGNHIDVFCASHELALEWGVQQKDITIIERNETK